jgi:PAS domain S-box-containing protein
MTIEMGNSRGLPMQSLALSYKWLAVTLSPEGIITTLSSGAEQFTGYSAQELVGRPITQILADTSVFELPRILDSANEWGHWEGELLHRTRAGRSMEARGALSVLAGAGNRSAGYLLVSNLTNTLLPAHNEDSVVTEIAGNLRNISHDINNPLAIMMGFTQLLILNPESKGKFKNDIEKLYSELKRVIQIVERLHVYAMSLYKRPEEKTANSA